ncbi:non-ribosomal peptide synthetase [Peterkaempfera bronchialis]|uniref:non-ribosomal peptide synthetase n=1 Tax=Peterkaempfera bronchialis TaxID=2126346 RepID=UPI003C2D2282
MTAAAPLDLLALCLGTGPAPCPVDPDALALRDRGTVLTYRQLVDAVAHRAAALRDQGYGPGLLVPVGPDRTAATVVDVLAVLAAGAAFTAAAGAPGTAEVLAGRRDLPDDAAYVMTTSGSTGSPKETVVTRRGLRHVFLALRARLAPALPPGARWAQYHPLTFGYALCEILGAAALGGELVLVGRESPLTCDALREALDSGRVDTVCLTPSELTLLADRLRTAGGTPPAHLLLSGEPAHRTQLADWFALPGAAHGRVWNTYAATETSGQITVADVTPATADATTAGWVGHPLPGVGVELRRADGAAVPPDDTDTTGEIWVTGPTVAAGYLDPGQTAERFAPAAGPGPAFRTGDTGRYAADGGLYVVGRTGRRVKVAGRWVPLDLVERAVLATGAVTEAAVVAGQLRLDGARPQECLVVAAVPKDRAPGTAVRLRRAATAALGAPLTVRLALPDALPRLPNGKVDVRRLAAPAAGAADRAADPAAVVRAVWEEILGVGVSVTANLFEIGADSLAVVTAAARLSHLLGQPVTAAQLLDAPRIDLQTARLSGRPNPAAPGGRAPAPSPDAAAGAVSARERRRAARRQSLARRDPGH